MRLSGQFVQSKIQINGQEAYENLLVEIILIFPLQISKHLNIDSFRRVIAHIDGRNRVTQNKLE